MNIKGRSLKNFKIHLIMRIEAIKNGYIQGEDSVRYEEILEKIKAIDERKHLGMIGENTKEKTLNEGLVRIVEAGYATEKEFQTVLANIETLLNDYTVKRDKEEQKGREDDGDER